MHSDNEPMNKYIRLCVKNNAFNEFNKALFDEVNVIITKYNTASKSLGDIIEEYSKRNMQLDYFLVINEVYLLLNHTNLIEIAKEFDKVTL